MKHLYILCTILFGTAVLLFFGLTYPHHLHYQEQFQLFLFDSTYVWDIVRHPGGIADLLGRFSTQFFLYAWVGALIIAVLLSAIQLLVLRLFYGQWSMVNGQWSMVNFDFVEIAHAQQTSSKLGLYSLNRDFQWLYGLSFVPSFLLWLFLLDENALMGGVWAVLLTLLAIWGLLQLPPKGRGFLLIAVIPVLYWMVGPDWNGSHYHRYPTTVPTLLYAAWLSAVLLPLFVRILVAHVQRSKVKGQKSKGKGGSKFFTFHSSLFTFLLVALIMGSLVWKNANFKAEKVMQYDFMACHQQWNRILETIQKEKPNNQIGVTVQNLALAMHGMLPEHMFEYNQNGIAGLLPDVQEDATSPMPTAEAFYQLGMINVAQRTVFEAQEAILDFQKSGRCYKRLAQTNLINGNYEVARKYLTALQKTLFYREWANETLPLLDNEEAIARHPEYGRLRKWAYREDFYFSDHVTSEMLKSLYLGSTDNHMAYQYLLAYYMLTEDREGFAEFQNLIMK